MAWFKVVIGLLLLIWSADNLVGYASKLAYRLNVPPLIIGLTIIGFGTSAPEIFVAIIASLKGNQNIALGNALGSNIANIGLVIGFTAMLQPIAKSTQTIRDELIALLLISFGIYIVLALFGFSIWVGILLISILIVFLFWLIKTCQRRHDTTYTSEFDKNHTPLYKLILALLISLLVLGAGSDLLVSGASKIALSLGVRETFIGLTVVAIGTSLPELFVSIVSIIKKQHGIAIGNIIGSNVFNLTAVLAPIALFTQDTKISKLVAYQDLPIMLLLTALFSLPFLIPNQKKLAINRLGGSLLLLTYICYLTLLIYQAKAVV